MRSFSELGGDVAFLRLKPGVVLLILLTALLIVFLAYRIGLMVPPSPGADGVHPRPVVKLLIGYDGEALSISGNGSYAVRLPRDLSLTVRLSNEADEPSLVGELAAGVLLRFEGARVRSYELKGFRGAIGIGEGATLIDPVNASVVEFFSDELGARQSAEARLRLSVEGGRCLTIHYRGWIIDEDDRVRNPASGSEEYYIARYPPERYPDNPPDSRWAGEQFLKYRVYVVELCPLPG